MKSNKIIGLLMALSVGLSSCVDGILNSDEKLEKRNVVLQLFTYYGNELLNPDSLHILGNSEVKFTDISFVYSGYSFVSTAGDTLFRDTAVNVQDLMNSLVYLTKIPGGTYSGTHYFSIGLDTNQEKILPTAYPEDHPMRGANLYRGVGKGYNYMVFKGTWRALGDTLDPTKPFSYVVASPLGTKFSKTMAFTVGGSSKARINIVLSIDKLLAGLDPSVTADVTCNPALPLDFALATSIKQNLASSYIIQL